MKLEMEMRVDPIAQAPHVVAVIGEIRAIESEDDGR